MNALKIGAQYTRLNEPNLAIVRISIELPQVENVGQTNLYMLDYLCS
jgi:hypothetical protein